MKNAVKWKNQKILSDVFCAEWTIESLQQQNVISDSLRYLFTALITSSFLILGFLYFP